MTTILRWQSMTPAEVLDAYPALTLTQAAYVLGLVHRRGKNEGDPARRLVLDRIAAGKLKVIDPTEPAHRWTVSATEIRRVIEGRAS